MTIYYVDTILPTNGSGSQLNPYNTIASVSMTNGDTCLIKTGSVIKSADIPAGLFSASNSTVAEYGTGDKPIITGGEVRADFSASSEPGIYQRTYASNIVGNVTEDGEIMKFVAFGASLAETAALMTAGSFSFDYTNFILYIKPSYGLPSDHEYVVSENLYCMYNTSTSVGLSVRNIRLESASRHAHLFFNKRQCLLDGIDVQFAGGIRSISGNYHLGNGIEFSKGCIDVECRNSDIQDIFDSAFSTQLYETAATLVSDHWYHNIVAKRCGMAGAEITIQSVAPQWIRNINIEDIELENIGLNNWSGNRGGWAVLNGATAGLGNGVVDAVHSRRFKVTNAQKMITAASTSGVNTYEDFDGVGIIVPGQTATTYGQGQADLLRNCFADGVVPSGGTFAVVDSLSEYVGYI